MDDESLRIQQQGINFNVLRAAHTAQQAADVAASNALNAQNDAIRERDNAQKIRKELDSYQIAVAQKNRELAAQQQKIDKLTDALAKKDELLLEWMQANEGFKRLARQYGQELGKGVEQVQQDVLEKILDVAEEDPKYANTKQTAKAKQSRS